LPTGVLVFTHNLAAKYLQHAAFIRARCACFEAGVLSEYPLRCRLFPIRLSRISSSSAGRAVFQRPIGLRDSDLECRVRHCHRPDRYAHGLFMIQAVLDKRLKLAQALLSDAAPGLRSAPKYPFKASSSSY